MGRTEEVGAENRGQIFYFKPERLKLITDPKHKLFQQSAVDPVEDWRVESVDTHGVIEPVVARKGKCVRGVYEIEIVVGRRRVLAARKVNLLRKAKRRPPIKVPVLIRVLTDAEALALIQAENRDRSDPSIMDDAISARNRIAEGESEQKVCNSMRWSKAQLDQHLALIECHREVHVAVLAGTIALAAVPDLRKLDKDDQPAALAKLIAAKAVGPKQVRRKLEQTNPENMAPAAKAKRRSKSAIAKLRAHLHTVLIHASPGDRRYLEGLHDAIKWMSDGAELKVGDRKF